MPPRAHAHAHVCAAARQVRGPTKSLDARPSDRAPPHEHARPPRSSSDGSDARHRSARAQSSHANGGSARRQRRSGDGQRAQSSRAGTRVRPRGADAAPEGYARYGSGWPGHDAGAQVQACWRLASAHGQVWRHVCVSPLRLRLSGPRVRTRRPRVAAHGNSGAVCVRACVCLWHDRARVTGSFVLCSPVTTLVTMPLVGVVQRYMCWP